MAVGGGDTFTDSTTDDVVISANNGLPGRSILAGFTQAGAVGVPGHSIIRLNADSGLTIAGNITATGVITALGGFSALSGVTLTGNSTIPYSGVLAAPWAVSQSNTYIIGSNVGIGTATPQSTLDVVGNIHASGTISAQGGFAFRGGSTLSGISLTGNSTIMYAGVIGSPWSVQGATTYIMSSNVGIGTLAPQVALDVMGDIHATGKVTADGGFDLRGASLSGVMLMAGSTIPYAGVLGSPWGVHGASTFIMTSNVGIGTLNPLVALDVAGNIHTTGTVTADGGYGFTTLAGVALTGNSTIPYAGVLGTPWGVSGATTSVMGSNVGIGTTTPKNALDVVGNIHATGTVSAMGGFAFLGDTTISGITLTGNSTIPYAGVLGSPWTVLGSNTFVLSSNVGIGTNTPQNALDVVGNIHTSGSVIADGGFIFKGVALSGVALTGNSTIPYSGVVGTPWAVAGATVSVMSSNVGIGTTAPKSALDVVGNIHTTGTVSADGGFAFPVGTTLTGIALAGNSTIQYSGVVGTPWAVAGAAVSVMNSNVGIGTTAPKNALDVVGNIHATGTVSAAGGFAFVGDSTVSGVSLTGSSTISYAGVLGSPWAVQGATTFVMNSNVGIGTVTPQYALDVVGSIHASCTVSAAGGFAFLGDSTLSGISLTGNSTIPYSGVLGSPWAISGPNTYVTGSNVGIGTTTPQNALDVVGNLHTTGTVTVDGGLICKGVSSLANIALTGNSTIPYVGVVGEPWTVAGANISVMSSNVGIGTTTPKNALDVVGNIHATGTVSAAGGFAFVGDSTVSGVSLTGSSTISYAGVLGSPWAVQGATTFVMNSNVGIGTVTPQYALDVVGSIHASGTVSATGGFAFLGDSTLSGISLTGNSTIPYSGVLGSPWAVSGANTYVTGSNVGIGTTTPQYSLDVVGNIHASGMVTAAGGFAFAGDASLSGISLVGNSTIPYAGVLNAPWAVSGATTFLIGSNVGIGTTTPQVPLDVVGNIHASGSIAATSISVSAALAGFWSLTSTNATVASGPAVTVVQSAWYTPSPTNSYFVGVGNTTASTMFVKNVITLPVKGIYNIGFAVNWATSPQFTSQDTRFQLPDGTRVISAYGVPGASASLFFNAGKKIMLVTSGLSGDN